MDGVKSSSGPVLLKSADIVGRRIGDATHKTKVAFAGMRPGKPLYEEFELAYCAHVGVVRAYSVSMRVPDCKIGRNVEPYRLP